MRCYAADTDVTRVMFALASRDDTELAAFIVVARCNKPRRSGACGGAVLVTASGAESRDLRGRG